MHVAILGGTGALGAGLAFRLGADTDHEVLIGSREAERARRRAAEYGTTIEEEAGTPAPVRGAENATAAREGDLVVLSVPPRRVRDAVDAVADALTDDQVVVSPAVGMTDGGDGALRYDPPSTGSVTELVADAVPDGAPVVGAFHTLPAERLADPSDDLGMDVPIVGDDDEAVREVAALVEAIDGLEPVCAGPLDAAATVETVTPLLVNVARHEEALREVGVRFQ